jgi:hypothetical protein
MILKLLRKLDRDVRYYVIAGIFPTLALAFYIAGSLFGPFGVIGLFFVVIGVLIAEAWMDCTG